MYLRTERKPGAGPVPPFVTLVIYVPVTDLSRVEAMTLSSMVVSRDWQEVSVLECILGGLHMDVSVENEPQRALARLSKSKIDALIVDCDLNGSAQFLRELQSVDTPKTVPLVIMGGPQCTQSLDQTGALFAFERLICKPVNISTVDFMLVSGAVSVKFHRSTVTYCLPLCVHVIGMLLMPELVRYSHSVEPGSASSGL